jgi:hypothetical protein
MDDIVALLVSFAAESFGDWRGKLESSSERPAGSLPRPPFLTLKNLLKDFFMNNTKDGSM